MALTTVLENVDKVQESVLNEAKSHKLNQQMQVAIGSQIEEHELLKVLGDEHARTILLSIIDESKSAVDIAREKNIPISSVYRKIHWLENARLIKVKGFVITGDGKKYHLYQSKIKTIHISLSNTVITVEFTDNNSRKRNSVQEQEIPIN